MAVQIAGSRTPRASARAAALVALLFCVSIQQGCYEPYPYYPPAPVVTSVPPSFDASWQAAKGAAYDEGVAVTYEDRAAGALRGSKGSAAVNITVARQANGYIRVEFNVVGPTAEDQNLQDRLTRAYQRRMGRP